MNKLEKINKKDSQLVNLESQLDLLLKGQEKNSDKLQIIGEELCLGFIGLAKQNSELLYLNKELNQQLEMVIAELDVMKKEREDKAARQKAWSKLYRDTNTNCNLSSYSDGNSD